LGGTQRNKSSNNGQQSTPPELAHASKKALRDAPEDATFRMPLAPKIRRPLTVNAVPIKNQMGIIVEASGYQK